MPRIHVVIKGRVQGVFFRQSAVDAAEDEGLAGWVRNLPDGDVEIVAEGPRENLGRFRNWCAAGPEGARIQDVIELPDRETGEFRVFSIRE